MISQMYKTAFALLLGIALTGCGSGSTDAPPAEPAKAPASLHTGRAIVLGGNELFEYDTLTRLIVPLYLGPCVDNLGQRNTDSASFMSYDAVGALTEYPGRVVIVANAFELTYVERWRTLENLTATVLHSTVTGAKVTLVGVPGEIEFNAELRNITRAYGATYSETLPELACD